MKIDLLKPALAGAAVLFCTLWLLKGCDKPVTKPDDGGAWRDSVQVLKNKLTEKDSLISQIQARRSAEIKKAQKDSSRLSIENRRLSVGYSRSKRQVQELQDSTGRIQAYVAVTDSLLNAKDSLYYQEVGHRIALEQLYKVEIATLADKNVIQVQLSEQYTARVDELGKENQRLGNKLERKKRGNRLLLGVSAGLAAALGVIIIAQ